MHSSLLDKFFRRECSEEEKERVLCWYLSGQADEVISRKIEALWQEERQENQAWGKEKIFLLVKARMDAPAAHRSPAHSQPNRRYPHWSYAAVVALLLCATGGTYYLLQPPLATQSPKIPSAVEQWVVKQTASGEKMTFTLADSSVIKLNSASKLSLHPTNPREVFLEGEAFFEVARDSLHPFQIHTGDLVTTVLGTSFNVNASIATGITVSVLTGRVEVRQAQARSAPAMCLLPGEQARYSRADTRLSKEDYAYADVFSWKDGRLYFDNAPFAEVVLALERWYGVAFEIQRTDIENGFSGSYTNQSLESVLNGVSFVLQFDYQIQGKKIIIR